MSLVKDTAVVLRRLDYSETSQVLAMFTRDHGQQRLIAKGIKRSTKSRTATGIDLLESGSIVFTQRPGKEDVLATLTEWKQQDTFPHLRRDLLRCYAAQYAAEATSHLTESHDPHPRLFDALVEAFHTLREGDALAVLDHYLWILLTEIGLRPEFGRCLSCARPVDQDRVAYISTREGGAICRDCEPAVVEKRRTRGEVLSWLSAGAAIGAGPFKEALDLLDYYITETLARPLRLAAPLREWAGMPARSAAHRRH